MTNTIFSTKIHLIEMEKRFKKENSMVAIFFSLLLALSTGTFAATIKIGVVEPLSGGTATFGQENINGLKMALEKINNSTTLKGHKIELIVEDDKSDQIEATNAIRKLINVDKVLIVVGEVTSSNTLAMAPIAQEAKVPLISSAATNEKVTTVGNYISRTCFTDGFQGVVMAKFAYNTLKKRNTLIVVDNTSDYSKGLAKSFETEWLKLGGKLATTDELSYSQKDSDFSTLIRKMIRYKPDVVFLPGYYEEVGKILKQARALGLTVPFLGGDGWDSPKLVEIAGPKGILGNYISSHFAPDDVDPKIQEFVKEYLVRYKVKPGAMAALGYDVIGVIANAISRAKNLTSEELNKALISTQNYPGITGNITLDSNRNSRKSAVVLETTATGFVFNTKVNP